MRDKFVELAEKEYLKSDLPEIKTGDQVSVLLSIKEGGKERTQRLDGLVIAQASTGLTKTITVRKISSGIGFERVLLIHSPYIKNIKILATGAKKIRRSKIYYMRALKGKKARIQYSEVNN